MWGTQETGTTLEAVLARFNSAVLHSLILSEYVNCVPARSHTSLLVQKIFGLERSDNR